MPNATTIKVVIRNKDKILFSGDVFAVTSVNDKGVFDILPQHESFISLIRDKITIHQTTKEKEEIQIENGVLRAYNNKVYAYVNFKS